jgi:calcineurin-like phosphoesterase
MADEMYNPFLKVEEILKEYELNELDWVVVDFHRETTSESQWMWFLLDGKASLVFGTHTHTQTNDDRILPKGTGFISDVWFCWPLNSVIWADFESLRKRFLTGLMRWKIEQKLENAYRLNGLFVEIIDKKCVKIEKIRIEKEDA